LFERPSAPEGGCQLIGRHAERFCSGFQFNLSGTKAATVATGTASMQGSPHRISLCISTCRTDRTDNHQCGEQASDPYPDFLFHIFVSILCFVGWGTTNLHIS
jgi:hypothetical protein